MKNADGARETDFDPAWLQLRAAYDAAAANHAGARALANAFGAALRKRQARGPVRLIDLGGGTGANICRLAPQIPGSQTWCVADYDASLLERVAPTVERWARRIGARFAATDDGVSVMTPQRIIKVSTRVIDLRSGLAGLALDTADGVAASALFDLVSADWLDAAAASLAEHGLPILATLSVDGRLHWRPEHAADAKIAGAFIDDLRGDKGFGPALGARAADAASRVFARHGYNVSAAPSDWAVATGDEAMHRALLGFIVPAAKNHAPAKTGAAEWARAVDSWAAAKSAEIRAGATALTLGHTDLLAVL